MKKVVRIVEKIFLYSMIYAIIYAFQIIVNVLLANTDFTLREVPLRGWLELLALGLCGFGTEVIFVIIHFKKRSVLINRYALKTIFEAFGFMACHILFLISSVLSDGFFPWDEMLASRTAWGMTCFVILICIALLPIIYFVYWIKRYVTHFMSERREISDL